MHIISLHFEGFIVLRVTSILNDIWLIDYHLYSNNIIKKEVMSFIIKYPTSSWIHYISRTRPKNKWVLKNAKKMTFARNKFRHRAANKNYNAKILKENKNESWVITPGWKMTSCMFWISRSCHNYANNQNRAQKTHKDAVC